MTHERQARLYFASGYSCEQAVFGAFADVLGLSPAAAKLKAPSRKERGTVCGAYKAGVLVIRTLYSPQRGNRAHGRKKEQEGANQRKGEEQALAQFKRLFMVYFGTTDCEAISTSREKGWSGADDVVGITARLVDRVLDGSTQP